MQKNIQGLRDEVIHVVCCADHNYVMPCGVMLKSLLVNNSECNIHIHLITDSTFIEKDKNSICKIVQQEHHKKLSIYNTDSIEFTDFPQLGTHTHISKAAYYRLFMPTILPKELEKVLYLDVDVIVMGSIVDLWENDINNFAIGAVIDQETDNICHYNRMRYPKEYEIFNSGVLLINLLYWRKNNLQKLFMDFMKNYHDRILYHDQDVLNCVLHSKKKLLSLRYNVQSAFFYHFNIVKYDMSKYQSSIDDAIKNPIILHFSTKYKPWNEDCFHPLKLEFVKYQEMTEWSGVFFEFKPQPFTLRKICRDFLCYLHLKPYYKFLESKYMFRKL